MNLSLFLEELSDAKKNKIVVFMGGGVAVGKSTFAQKIFGNTFKDFISIKPDALTKDVKKAIMNKKSISGFKKDFNNLLK